MDRHRSRHPAKDSTLPPTGYGSRATGQACQTRNPHVTQPLIELLSESARFARETSGWVSASIHKSLDGTRVVNYAQSASAQAVQRVTDRLREAGFLDRNRGIGEAHPCLYEVVFTLDRAWSSPTTLHHSSAAMPLDLCRRGSSVLSMRSKHGSPLASRPMVDSVGEGSREGHRGRHPHPGGLQFPSADGGPRSPIRNHRREGTTR